MNPAAGRHHRWQRRLADTLATVSLRLLPVTKSGWGQGMASEVQSIPDDGAAVRWAAGCLRSAVTLRLADILARYATVRWVIGLYLLSNVFAQGCFIVIGLAARSGSQPLIGWLARHTQAPSYFLAQQLLSHPFPLAVAGSVALLSLTGTIVFLTQRYAAATELLLAASLVQIAGVAATGWLMPDEARLLAATWSTRATVETLLQLGLVAWLWCARRGEWRPA